MREKLAKFMSGRYGPDALFRAQYLAGMLKVQVQTGLKTSQSASQGMESILRQQG